jgi:hypothetical protein
MMCDNCKDYPTIKVTEKWISIQCRCQNITIYPDAFVKRTSIKEYDPNHKKENLVEVDEKRDGEHN